MKGNTISKFSTWNEKSSSHVHLPRAGECGVSFSVLEAAVPCSVYVQRCSPFSVAYPLCANEFVFQTKVSQQKASSLLKNWLDPTY